MTDPGCLKDSSSVGAKTEDALAQDAHQVASLPVLEHRLRQALPLLGWDPTSARCEFRATGDVRALSSSRRRDDLARIQETVLRAGVESGVAATHGFDEQVAAVEGGGIDVGNPQFAAHAGLDRRRNVAVRRMGCARLRFSEAGRRLRRRDAWVPNQPDRETAL